MRIQLLAFHQGLLSVDVFNWSLFHGMLDPLDRGFREGETICGPVYRDPYSIVRSHGYCPKLFAPHAMGGLVMSKSLRAHVSELAYCERRVFTMDSVAKFAWDGAPVDRMQFSDYNNVGKLPRARRTGLLPDLDVAFFPVLARLDTAYRDDRASDLEPEEMLGRKSLRAISKYLKPGMIEEYGVVEIGYHVYATSEAVHRVLAPHLVAPFYRTMELKI